MHASSFYLLACRSRWYGVCKLIIEIQLAIIRSWPQKLGMWSIIRTKDLCCRLTQIPNTKIKLLNHFKILAAAALYWICIKIGSINHLTNFKSKYAMADGLFQSICNLLTLAIKNNAYHLRCFNTYHHIITEQKNSVGQFS